VLIRKLRVGTVGDGDIITKKGRKHKTIIFTHLDKVIGFFCWPVQAVRRPRKGSRAIGSFGKKAATEASGLKVHARLEYFWSDKDPDE